MVESVARWYQQHLSSSPWLVVASLTSVAAAGAVHMYMKYRKDMKQIRSNLQTLPTKTFCSSKKKDGDGGSYQIQYMERRRNDDTVSDDGYCCLVLHPAGGGCDQGLSLGELLLPSDYDIIAISRSGYLNSSISKKEDIGIDQALQEEVETIMELLDEQLGSTKKKISIMGFSAGGILALELARRHPTPFHNLILLSPLVPYKATEEVIPNPPEWILKFAFGSDFIKWIAIHLFTASTYQSLFGSTNDVSLNPQLTKVMECLLPAQERYSGFLFDFRCMQSYRLNAEDLMSITCPILFVASENDTQTKLETNRLPAQLLQKHPTTKEIIIQQPNACHMLLNDVSGTKDTIATFLAES